MFLCQVSVIKNVGIMENMAEFCRQYDANKHCVALKFVNVRSQHFVCKALDCLEPKSIKMLIPPLILNVNTISDVCFIIFLERGNVLRVYWLRFISVAYNCSTSNTVCLKLMIVQCSYSDFVPSKLLALREWSRWV